MTKRINGQPDMRYSVNKTFVNKERLFWQKYGCYIISILFGLIAGAILTKTLYDVMNPEILSPINKAVVKEVEAYEIPCDFDPITYIRCKGEKLNMPNQDIMKMIRIAKCESGYNEYAKNPNSTAKGIFQFIDSTWRENCLKDGNVYDFTDNIDCAWKVYKEQNDRPWHSSYSCWNI